MHSFYSHSQTVNGNKIFMMQYILFYISPQPDSHLAIAIFLMHYPNELLNVVNIYFVCYFEFAEDYALHKSAFRKKLKTVFNESKVASLLLIFLLLKRH